MKTYRWKLILMLVATALFSCSDETNFSSQQTAVTFTLSSSNSLSQTSLSELPENSSLLITLEDENGDLLYDMDAINLTNENGSLITEAISLPRGNYKLVDFVIISDDDQVLYASPRSGSNLANGVNITLPYNFTVSEESFNIFTDVVNVQSSSKKDFGYSGRIIANRKHFALLIKTYEQPSDLGPESSAPRMQLAGTGTITIHWGDGETQNYTLTSEESEVLHVYDNNPAEYQIVISGDVENITKFSMAYGYSDLLEIRTQALTNLVAFGLSLTNSPESVNLTKNYKLEHVGLTGTERLEHLLLPSRHNIIYLSITGQNNLSTKAVDKIIHNIYWSVRQSPRTGVFNLGKYWELIDQSSEMVGPPSSYSINKLKVLRDTYGWEINPNF